MSKTAETSRKNHSLLKVSKTAKMYAASAAMRGNPYRQMILLMGEAEKNYAESGRLVLGEGRSDK